MVRRNLVEAELFIIIGTDPFGSIDPALLDRWIVSPPASCCGRTPISEAAISILFCSNPEPRAYSNEVDVQALMSSTKFTQTIAAEIFKVYSPAPFLRGVCCKVMLGVGRPLADSGDVSPDLNGQGVPEIILIYSTALGNGRKFTAKQNTKRIQHTPNCHSPHLSASPAQTLSDCSNRARSERPSAGPSRSISARCGDVKVEPPLSDLRMAGRIGPPAPATEDEATRGLQLVSRRACLRPFVIRSNRKLHSTGSSVARICRA